MLPRLILLWLFLYCWILPDTQAAEPAPKKTEVNPAADQVKLRVIEFKKNPASSVRTRALAKTILEKLNSGAPFAEYAAVYSEGSGRNDGGSWGWIDRGTLPPELEKIAFELPPGKLSSLIELPDASYILLVEEKRGPGPRQSLPSADAKSPTAAEPNLPNPKERGRNQALPGTKAPSGAHTEPGEVDRKLFLAEKAAAEKGNAAAQHNLGVRYERGEGVARDEGEAVKWYRKAAEQNEAVDQYNLGVRYEKGPGVAKDYAEAVKWYRKAAEQNYAGAQNNLGLCYAVGLGVAQNHVEAVKWYRKAAAQNYAHAQYNLGGCYYAGHGVKQDYVEAVKWYRKAAAQNYALAQFNLGCIYGEGQGVPKDDAEAAQWYRKAAEQNYALAQGALGVMYANGHGVVKSQAEAYAWLTLAARTLQPAKPDLNDLVKQMSPDQIFEGYQRTKVLRTEIEAREKAAGN